MKKLKDWIYKFDSYNLWVYKNGRTYLTKDYQWLGKKRQRDIRQGSNLWIDIMAFEKVIWHENLE